MNLNDFAKLITEQEGLRVSTNISQVKEILRLTNKAISGRLYSWVRIMDSFEVRQITIQSHKKSKPKSVTSKKK